MLEKLKKLDITLALLVILSLNSIRDINIAQSIVALGIFSLVAYGRWLEHAKKPDVAAELRAELEHVKSNMSGLMIKNASKPQQTQQDIKRFF